MSQKLLGLKILALKGGRSYAEYARVIKAKTGSEIHPTTLHKIATGGKKTFA